MWCIYDIQTESIMEKVIKHIKIKNKFAFVFWLLATLCCMAAIYYFSSQPSEISGNLSGSLTRNIIRVFIGLFRYEGYEASDRVLSTAEFLVRKGAHFFVFFVLAFCVTNTVRQITNSKKHIFLIALCISSFYAITDELHQYFVPGRAAMWQDWLLDTAGAFFGVIAALCLFRKSKTNVHNEERSEGRRHF